MTPPKALRLLIVENDAAARGELERLLDQSSLCLSEIRHADRLAAALRLMQESPFDLVLLDPNLPDSLVMESITRLRAQEQHVPIIVLTELDDEQTGADAIRSGAQDYLIKEELDARLLIRSIGYALERRRAERELQAAEQRYRTIVENSPVAIMMADRDERLLSWNEFTERLLGMTQEELFGRNVASLYPEQEWDRIRKMGIREQGVQRHIETKMVRTDGGVIDVDVFVGVLRDADGAVTGSIGVVRDITERKRLHEILDRKQKNLEAIFDAAPLGMLLIDERRRVVRANDTIRQMSGKGYRDIINQDPCWVITCAHADESADQRHLDGPCDACQLWKLIALTFESGTAVRGVEARPALCHDEGQAPPWFSVSVEPVVIDGHRHVVVALNDVTDRKRAEEQVRETMELKSQFISTVSHELRTPLTAMKEAVIIVADEVAGKLNKDQKHFVDIARRNIDRLARLIDDVLDFQKLNAGRMELHKQPNQMDRTVEEAYNTMRPHAQQKQVHLAVDLESNLPPAVYDHDRIIQVLTNLVSNAIKFTPEGGTVSVAVRRADESVVVSVSDTGLGIPKEALPKIFTQFYRVHRPGKEIKGTGLGLAIVSKIVAAHGGRVEVASEVNKGTTFTIWLPCEPKQPATDLSEQADEHLEETLQGTSQSELV